MIFNHFAIVTLCASVLGLFLSVFTWKRRKNHPAVATLAKLFVTMTIWNLFYALELASTDLLYIKTFAWLAYTGIVTLPVLGLIFAARYANRDAWLTPLTTALLFIVPALILVMLSTNDKHQLFYSNVELSTFGVVHYQKTTAGPFWWLHVIYSYLMIFSGLFIFLRMFFSVQKETRFRIGIFILGLSAAFCFQYRLYYYFSSHGIL